MSIVDDTAKLLEEKLKMLSLKVEEEFEGTEEQLAKIRASALLAAGSSRPHLAEWLTRNEKRFSNWIRLLHYVKSLQKIVENWRNLELTVYRVTQIFKSSVFAELLKNANIFFAKKYNF